MPGWSEVRVCLHPTKLQAEVGEDEHKPSELMKSGEERGCCTLRLSQMMRLVNEIFSIVFHRCFFGKQNHQV